MGAIQGAINSALGTTAAGVAGAKHLKEQATVTEIAKAEQESQDLTTLAKDLIRVNEIKGEKKALQGQHIKMLNLKNIYNSNALEANEAQQLSLEIERDMLEQRRERIMKRLGSAYTEREMTFNKRTGESAYVKEGK